MNSTPSFTLMQLRCCASSQTAVSAPVRPAGAGSRAAAGHGQRYPSDLTDREWAVIEPLLPPRRRGRGRPPHPRRVIVDAILYVLRTAVHDTLREQVRAAAGRQRQPSAAVIDSQSVRAADTVPKATRGWDNAKKVNGRKLHIAVDTTGLLLQVVVTAASVQDRDGARPLLWNLRRACRRIRLTWADAAYTGKITAWAATMKMNLQIVARRNPHAFEVLPRRWVAERTFAWISKHRRTTRDYERLPASHEATNLWAMIAS